MRHKKIIFKITQWNVQKNFQLAESYFQEIKEYDFVGDVYQAAWNKISELLNKITDYLNRYKDKAIVMYWIDNVSFNAVKKMPYVYDMIRSGANFVQMYTCTPLTNPTARTLFCGIKTVDDVSYKISEINYENSKLLRILRKFGVTFYLVSGRLVDSFAQNVVSDYYHSENTPCSELLWDSLRCMVLSCDKRKFILVHLLQEVHPQAST